MEETYLLSPFSRLVVDEPDLRHHAQLHLSSQLCAHIPEEMALSHDGSVP